MSFNSLSFVVFLPVVILLYYALPSRFQWIILLAASYVFYAWWNIPYTLLLFGVTVASYTAGLMLGRQTDGRKRGAILVLGTAAVLSGLLFFKYADFAIATLNDALSLFGSSARFPLPGWLLPVGISFYVFQSLSYVFDVYRGKRAPEKHLGIYALYVSFFPQLVAGPIERSTRLLPQFRLTHKIDYTDMAGGMRLIMWGFFKKVVIADRLAVIVDAVYGHPAQHPGLPLTVATYCFALQILCDFSAYTDIARGTARILGIHLMENFDAPYFASSIRTFWRRWHISLTSWFRDYVYIPLGGNRTNRRRWIGAVIGVFLLSGLWHGAAWTFVVWGALHAIYYIMGRATANIRNALTRLVRLDRFPALSYTIGAVLTFHLVTFAWIFFRAESVGSAWYVVANLSFTRGSLAPAIDALGVDQALVALAGLTAYLTVEAVRRRHSVTAILGRTPAPFRWAVYYALALVLLFLAYASERPEFIYFQF